MADIFTTLSLSVNEAVALALICFAAGVVRGFTGFALSAFGLAMAVLILPPVQLIPVMWWLEMAASLVMLRHGWGGADMKVALTLVAGSAIGVILGLALTTQIDPGTSRLVALCLLIALAVLQLMNIRIPKLDTQSGTVITGLCAGIATGLAGIGGMVVALFILARNDSADKMRATLVAYLFLSSAISMLTHLYFGTMNTTSTLRGLALIAPCVLGVLIGQRLFTPRFQPYYRPACLSLLIGLGALSLARSVA